MTKKASSYKYKLVEIIWDDAEAGMGWEAPPLELAPALATSIGFLVKESDDHVMICSTYDANHTNARLQIPKGMIKTMRELKISQPRQKNKKNVNGTGTV